MCTVYDFQRLIFGNIQSPKNLTGNPKTTNQRLHCAPSTPSTRSMEQPDIYPDSKNTLIGWLFLPYDMADSYKAFLSDDGQPPEHVSTTPLSLSLPNPSSNKLIQYFLPNHLFRATLTYSWFLPLLICWASLWNCSINLKLLTWTIVKRSDPETALISISRPKYMLTSVVDGRSKPHQPTLANMTAHN